MNQQQLLVLYLPLLSPLATLAIVMVGFLYNNSRLSDFGARMGDIRASMGDMRDMLRAEIKGLQSSVEGEIRVLRATMEKNQSEVLSKFAELETRVSRIEE
jgi:hypothetical protein